MKIVLGVTLCVIGVLGFSGWLAYVPDGVGDVTTSIVGILPVAIIGGGAFLTADGIAEDNGLPPYGENPA